MYDVKMYCIIDCDTEKCIAIFETANECRDFIKKYEGKKISNLHMEGYREM